METKARYVPEPDSDHALAEKLLTIDQAEPLLLFGFNDIYLKRIEAAFPDTQIVARGNQVMLRGELENVTHIERLLNELVVILNRNGNLTENDVETVLALFESGDGAGPVASSTRDVVLYTPTGSMIRAKTPNQTRLVESARKNDIIFAIGPAGTGKCVAAGTLVLSDQGLRPIEDLASGPAPGDFAARRHGIMSMSGPAQTSHVYNGGITDTIRLTTRHGFEIKGTPEHPLLTLTPEGYYAWRRLETLQTGDFVALMRDTQYFGNRTAAGFTYQRKQHDTTSRAVSLSELDEDFAYFLGLMVGDGCMYANPDTPGGAVVMLSTADATISHHLEAVCARWDLPAPKYGYDHRIASTQLYALNEHLGVLDVPAPEKRVPHAILQAPKPQVVAFLQGLFDADGTVDRRNGNVSLSSSSKRLAQDVQIILLNLGIVACLRCKTTTHRDCFTLEMYGREADRFFEEVGFRLIRKQALRRVAPCSNPNLDLVPNIAPLIDAAVRLRRFSRAQHKILYDYRTGRRAPGYTKLRALIDLIGSAPKKQDVPEDDLARLQRIAADAFLWSEVTALEPDRAQVYDLTVPDEHNFIAGGFVNHNTYTAVALAVSALKSRQVKRIVLCRPAVEAGERLGFLPGDFREKVDPYLRPLYDALEDMLPPDKLRAYMEQNVVEIVPLAYMRGRTINSAFVILDEAQNATALQMKMFLTRLGVNSRAIITGDATQIDLPSRTHSGLLDAEQILRGIDGIDFIYFEKADVVRHRLVMDIIDAYEQSDDETGKKVDSG